MLLEQTKMKPPFSYYGGKQKIVSKILPLIPKHTVYVEPFSGAATLLFAKGKPHVTNNNHYLEVLNDTNHDVINFFEVMRDYFEELQHFIEHGLYSQELYRRSKDLGLFENKIERAYMFFININQSFAKKQNAGWGTCVFGQNQAISFQNKVERFKTYKDRLQGCYIACEDAVRCIERWDSPQAFFYCDPPYPNTNQGAYSGYTLDDFRKLVQVLDKCQGSFILSCYPMADMPSNWERFEFNTYMSANGVVGKSKTEKHDRGDIKRTECLWRRMNTVEPRQEILRIYEYSHCSQSHR